MSRPDSRDHGEANSGEDLSSVLKRIMDWRYSTRGSKEARVRLANDEITRELLEAGLRLINQQFDPLPEPADDDPEIEASAFFKWLSIARVVKEVGRAGKLRATEAHARDRWKYRAHYIEDILAYALWDHHWRLQKHTADQARENLSSSHDLVEAVHQAAYEDHCALLENRSYRISVMASTLTARSSTLQEAFGSIYEFISETWSDVYRDVLDRRGLKLRPGISVDDFTAMLTAVADGVASRSLFDDSERLIDHGKARSLIGTAALAITAACIDPGDGQSLEQIIQMLAG
jgi:hypothetical protein